MSRMHSKAEAEFARLAESPELRRDMAVVAKQRHNPFVRDGRVDVEACIEFLCQYNAFVNHQRRRFEQIVDRDMRL